MIRSALALVVLASLALAQDRGFSTGPPNVPGVSTAPRPTPTDDLPSPPDGDDIKANPLVFSAQNETSLAVNPNDPLNWVGTANDYRLGSVETGWYTTTNGGLSWTTGTFGVDPGWSFSGDPCVAFANNGDAHLVCMMYDGPGGVDRVKAFKSTNGGFSWSSSSIVGAVAGYDKPQIEIDLSTSAFAGTILVAWDHFGATFSSDDIIVSTSDDGGVTWSSDITINDFSTAGIAPDVAWGPNGEAYVMWADRGVDDILFDRSFDGGVTWGADVKVVDFSGVPDPLPGSPFRMFDVFAMHADQSTGPYSGNIYVAWHNWASGSGNHRADIRVSTSSNQGSSWSPGIKITSDGEQKNDQVFPGVVVDQQGGVAVSYYDQRNDSNDRLLWTWVSRSLDGGATWSDVQVSDVGWDPGPTEFGGTFIGDYIDNEAAPNGLIYPFWCDGRNGTQDVYTDEVNLVLHTTPSELSAAVGGTVNFYIDIGPNHAGDGYFLLASGSGTSPGIAAGGINVPINPDFWTDLSIVFANSAIFPNSTGILSATGSATTAMNTLGPFPAAFAGTNLDFTVIAYPVGGGVSYATPPTRVVLTL